MGGGHEIFPGPCRKTATGDLFHRGAVVIAEPDARGQIACVADKKCVAEGLGGAGFSRRLPALQARGLARTFGNDARQHSVHGRGDFLTQHTWRIVVFVFVKNLAVGIGDTLDDAASPCSRHS